MSQCTYGYVWQYVAERNFRADQTVSMQSCRMKATFPDVVTFQFPYNCESVQVPVVVTAEEVGEKAMDNNILTNLLPPGLGLKPGEIFGILAGEEKKMFFCHKALPRTKIDEDQT
nr:hypothetical protein [Tanacetum cinerariifolium]